MLARADSTALDAAFAQLALLPTTQWQWLRRPETGLVMVRGRIGGSGAKFNLGEVPVTRCTVRLENGTTGTAWVRGRDARHAERAAQLDALLQQPQYHDVVQRDVIAPMARAQSCARELASRKAAATTVAFYTLARGEDK